MHRRYSSVQLLLPHQWMCPLPRRAYHWRGKADQWRDWEETGPYADRIGTLLDQATRHAIFLGWEVHSRFPMASADGHIESLLEKLVRRCTREPAFHAYLLFWDHASFYIALREKFQRRLWSGLHPRIHFVFDPKLPWGASHHEKIILIDGIHGFCGGIDLCNKRRDYPEHHWSDLRRSLDQKHESHGPYHDRALEVQGDIVRALHEHAAQRWSRVSDIPFPAPPSPERAPNPPRMESGWTTYLSRTASYPRPFLKRFKRGIPHPRRRAGIIRENERLVLALIRQARQSILIEGQYYWSKRIARALIRKLSKPGAPGLHVTLILTDLTRLRALTRQMSAHGYQLLAALEEAAILSGGRLTIGFPLVPSPSHTEGQAKPVYVHSKLLVVDDHYISIGSTNLAARAFRVDSEVNVTLEARTPLERRRIEHFTRRTLAHWGLSASPSSSARLQIINAREELARWSVTHPFLSRFPWKVFFDPEEPWWRSLKRWLRRVLLR